MRARSSPKSFDLPPTHLRTGDAAGATCGTASFRGDEIAFDAAERVRDRIPASSAPAITRATFRLWPGVDRGWKRVASRSASIRRRANALAWGFGRTVAVPST